MVLEDFLRSARKFYLSVYLATQHFDLPPELRAAVLANCSRFFAFATSAADAALLGKEFGGAEGALVAERLPELKVGQAFVKFRGQPVRVLRVSPPSRAAAPQRVEELRAQCASLGASREDIDKDIERRTARFGLQPAGPDESSVSDEPGEDLPEGYVGY